MCPYSLTFYPLLIQHREVNPPRRTMVLHPPDSYRDSVTSFLRLPYSLNPDYLFSQGFFCPYSMTFCPLPIPNREVNPPRRTMVLHPPDSYRDSVTSFLRLPYSFNPDNLFSQGFFLLHLSLETFVLNLVSCILSLIF